MDVFLFHVLPVTWRNAARRRRWSSLIPVGWTQWDATPSNTTHMGIATNPPVGQPPTWWWRDSKGITPLENPWIRRNLMGGIGGRMEQNPVKPVEVGRLSLYLQGLSYVPIPSVNSGIGIGCIINRKGVGSHWKSGHTSQPFFRLVVFQRFMAPKWPIKYQNWRLLHRLG